LPEQDPHEAHDTLPLAAEPYAAAVDVVLEAAASNFTRRALMALLRSPHFRFAGASGITSPRRAEADRGLAAHHLGGLDRLASLSEVLARRARPWRCRGSRPSCRPSASTVDDRPGRAASRISRGHDHHQTVVVAPRCRRTPAALADSFRRHDPAAPATAEVAAAARRWTWRKPSTWPATKAV
jgi:hypothetical protein